MEGAVVVEAELGPEGTGGADEGGAIVQEGTVVDIQGAFGGGLEEGVGVVDEVAFVEGEGFFDFEAGAGEVGEVAADIEIVVEDDPAPQLALDGCGLLGRHVPAMEASRSHRVTEAGGGISSCRRRSRGRSSRRWRSRR